MSYENFVQLQLSAPLAIAGTTITVASPVGPNRLPPAEGGILILADSVGSPAFVEIIRYTSRTGNTLSGVVRALEGTSARAWPVGSFCYQALTAAAFASLLASKLDAGATAVAAAKLATARTINGVVFDGTADVTIQDSTKLPLTGGTVTGRLIGSAGVAVTLNQRFEFNAGNVGIGWGIVEAAADGTLRFQTRTNTGEYGDRIGFTATGDILASSFSGDGAGIVNLKAANLTGVLPDARLSGTYAGASIGGNAATATKLASARTINGVAFDGSANITIADPASVTKAGDTMTGNLTMADNAQVRLGTDADLRIYHSGSHSYIDQSVTGNLYIRNNVTGGTILFYADNTGGTSQLVAQMGVGTDNAAHLYAAGASKLNTTAAGVAVTGTIIASSNITAYSDERLKEKIEIIPQALNKVVQLRGVTYNRKDSGERHTGVIAQDVQKVMPEAVIQGEEYLSVAYGNLVGLLIESIKELNGKVDLLQEEVTELRRAA